MLFQWIRLIRDDGGTLTDQSIDNQDESTLLTFDIDSANDYVYVGQHFPFNNFFLQVDTANATAADIEIEYWNGRQNNWVSAVDVLDGTKSAGVPCAKSGVVQFSPDPGFAWVQVRDTENEPMPLGLTNFTIFNIYWLRFRYSANLDAGTRVKRLAYAFTRTQQISNLDNDIDRFLTSFGAGKTDWDDEIITASILLVNDLRSRGLIVAPGNILRFDDVSVAADWKTLIHLYRDLGPSFRQKLIDAQLEYEKSLSLGRFSFDKNQDAFLQNREITNTVGKLVR